MNRNENETKSFAGNFAASKKQRLFFEVPFSFDIAPRGPTRRHSPALAPGAAS